MTNTTFLYIEVAITFVIAISLFILIFLNIKKSKSVNIKQPELSYQKIIEDLMKIIQYKCFIAHRRLLQPLVDKSLKNKPLLNDKIVNAVSIQVTKEILEELSEEYLSKLYSIYKKEKVEDIILELVYNTVTEMALDINKTSIKQMNIGKTFKEFTKNDIDS